MIIDHIGIAVKSLDDAINLWSSVFGYIQQTEIIVNTRQKVRVVFLVKKNSLDVKLIEPTDNSSPIFSFAQRGGGLHHLCFKCDDLKGGIEDLRSVGLRVLTEPQPGEAFANENIAFIYAGHGLNVEIIDSGKRAGIIANNSNP